MKGEQRKDSREWGVGLSEGESKLSSNTAEFIGALRATEGWAPV